MKKTTETVSIYIHYPFCLSKCPYCDFNSHVANSVNYQNFLESYEKEIDFFAQKVGKRKVTTIFFGGGTPSLMPIFLVEAILNKISKTWQLDKNCEISLEANPTSFESKKFQDLKQAGINRLSLGIQSLNDQDLKFLGREHSSSDAIKTIEIAGKIFDNFSFDLIYARPNQTLKSWEEELKTAINFGTPHLSLYQLTIEKGTKFFNQYQKNQFIMPNEELSAKFYELTNKITEKHGLNLYEISNYAKKGKKCKHNLAYWQGDDYIGIGAGAHSRVYFENEKYRKAIMMIHEPNNWLKTVKENGNGIQKINDILEKELLEELVLMSLRLKTGLTNKILAKHFNKNISELFDVSFLKRLKKQKIIKLAQNKINIHKKHYLITNEIIRKISENILLK